MTARDLIQEFAEHPIIFFCLMTAVFSYAYLLAGSSYFNSFYKSNLFRRIILYFFIFNLYSLIFGGTTLSFLDRWTRYGGTILSFATNTGLSLAVMVMLAKAGLMNTARSLKVIINSPLLAVLSSIILFSIASSDTPIVGLTSVISYLLTIFISTQIAQTYSWAEFEKGIRLGLSFLALLTLLVSLLSPSNFSTNEPWGGLIGGRKYFGILCALITSQWLLYWISSQKFSYVFPLCASFFSLFVFFGNSITGLITLIACLYSLFLTSSSRFLKRKDAQLILTILGPISLILISVFVYNFPQIAIFFGKDPTFTGRTLIWQILIDKVNDKNPLLGYGYNGFWQVWRGSDSPSYNLKPDPLGDYVAPHAHNGFVEVFVQIGYLGLAIYMLLFIYVIFKAAKKAFSERGIEQRLPLLLVTFLIFSNIGETSRLGMIGPNFDLFVLVVLYVKQNNQLSQKTTHHSNPYLSAR